MSIENFKRGLKAIDEMVQEGTAQEVPDDSELLEKCDAAVCLKFSEEALARIPDIWRDQVAYGTCSDCGDKIFFRNNNPQNARLICFECACIMMQDQEEDEGQPMIITRKSGAEELREYIKKKEQN